MELQLGQSADFLQPHLNGKATLTDTLSNIFPKSAEILLASSLDVKGVTFGRKQFLLLSSTCAVEVHAAVKEDKNFYLLVEILETDPVDRPKAVGQTYWRRSVGAARSQALLPLKEIFAVAFCPVFARDDGQNVLLLEWIVCLKKCGRVLVLQQKKTLKQAFLVQNEKTEKTYK